MVDREPDETARAGEVAATGGAPISVLVDAGMIAPGRSAGVEVFTCGLLNGLAADPADRLRVRVLSGTADEWRGQVPSARIEWSEMSLPLRTDTPGGQVLRRWTPATVRNSRAVRRVIGTVRKSAVDRLPEADVVLVASSSWPALPARSVVVLHDLRHLSADLGAAGFADVVRDNVRRAAAVVVTWPHPYRQAIETFPEAADKTVLIPTPPFQSAPDRSVARPERGLLIYPASTADHKNHATLLEAVALLPDCRLVCPGPLVEPAASRLLHRADQPDLRGRVSFPGFVPVDVLQSWYARADAVVIPSRWEAASGAMLEAWSWGLPVACADSEPLLAQLEFAGGEAAVFPALDPVALAGAVRAVMGERERFAAASRRAHGRLAGRTWADTGRDYRAVLRWVAAGCLGPIPRSEFGAELAGA